MRLKELEKEGFITCAEEKKSPMMVLWRLTEKGKDTLPILMQLVAFGSIPEDAARDRMKAASIDD